MYDVIKIYPISTVFDEGVLAKTWHVETWYRTGVATDGGLKFAVVKIPRADKVVAI